MRRRTEAFGTYNVWPAFTDVLGGLVVVLVFLITIFVIGEVLIGRELSGKDTAIDQLARIIDGLEKVVGDSRDENQRLQERLGTLEEDLALKGQSLLGMEQDLVAALGVRENLEQQLAITTDDKTQLETRLDDATVAFNRASQERDAASRESQLSARRLALLEARIADLGFKLERLNQALYGARQDVAAGRDELSRSAAELDAAARQQQDLGSQLAERDAQIATQQDRIAEMDALIKRRLLDRVEELEQYSSDFFGRLRKVFANNPDIKVEGDRFVFQSEVLFPSGESHLSFGGRDDLDKFVEVYKQVESRLPDDLPVIIEVQGHTDRIPIHTSRFRSNWELSVYRALGVVNYLISKGVPPQRLAAVGMGEYHPIVTADDPGAMRKNRRIELKITSR